ncbi:MAG: DUF2786 domain-containing protein [Gammaproteobacteria bacterium]|nr:DUF2786 domain-containing protein [Gammaproteobacteria bacterium]
MTGSEAIKKIQKCLARADDAAGTTEGEAASALKIARALMKRYGLAEDACISMQQVNDARRSAGKRPPFWKKGLGSVCAQSFNCTLLRRGDDFIFVGIMPAAEIAGYAYDVLVRKLRNDRTHFVKKSHGNVKVANRKKRGNDFARAWVEGVYDVVRDFAGYGETSQAVADYIESKYIVESCRGKPQQKRMVNQAASMAGYFQGAQARLHHGMPRKEPRKELGEKV